MRASDEGFNRVVISRLDGSGLREVFKPTSWRVWRPSWSKDGKWVAFGIGATFAKPEQGVDIWKFGIENRASINLTADAETNDAFPDFSPDGRRIVFRSGQHGNHEIYLMNSDGSDRRRLTHHDAVDTMPAFSSSGDKIAFTSKREDDDYEIYVMDLDADGNVSPPRRVTNSRGRDTHPKFSPDDRWLVFASEKGGMNDEAPLIPVFNPQPYGEIFAVRLTDGLHLRLTHNKWEDGTPTWGLGRKLSSEALRLAPSVLHDGVRYRRAKPCEGSRVSASVSWCSLPRSPWELHRNKNSPRSWEKAAWSRLTYATSRSPR